MKLLYLLGVHRVDTPILTHFYQFLFLIDRHRSNLGFYHTHALLASVGVTPRIFPTFTIAPKQEELESSVLQ